MNTKHIDPIVASTLHARRPKSASRTPKWFDTTNEANSYVGRGIESYRYETGSHTATVSLRPSGRFDVHVSVVSNGRRGLQRVVFRNATSRNADAAMRKAEEVITELEAA